MSKIDPTWARAFEVLADWSKRSDEPDMPTARAVASVCNVALVGQQRGWPCPAGIAGTDADGCVMDWRVGEDRVTIEALQNGVVETTHIHAGKVVSMQITTLAEAVVKINAVLAKEPT